MGKTTTVVHLAHYFARNKQKVLVVDLDTQGHVALSYNNDRGDALRDVLLRRRRIPDAQIEARPNLWIVPNSKSSEELIPYLMNMRQREFALADILEDVKEDYDWIFLDTPPSANLLHDLAQSGGGSIQLRKMRYQRFNQYVNYSPAPENSMDSPTSRQCQLIHVNITKQGKQL